MCVVNLQLTMHIDQFLESTEELPTLWVVERGFQPGVSQFCTSLDLICLFVIIAVPFFQWARSFTGWAILGIGQVQFTEWKE